ncbi:hypothetical protein LCGC14_1149840 [marine sediment metagenome]|uniref:Uncharacterized protein n=1 Tax=marine sediment metagenome TaxID=412755 RepID=A0A0F9PDY7_9ZZZZ
MEKRSPNCFTCYSYKVCKGREEILVSYIMYKEYWRDGDAWGDLLDLLASKCRYYNYVTDEAIKKMKDEK